MNMNAFEISRSQISKLHNGKCALYQLQQFVDQNLKDSSPASRHLSQAMAYLVPVITGLMDEVDKVDDTVRNETEVIRTELKLRAVWSIFGHREFPQSWAGKTITYQGRALTIPTDEVLDRNTMYVIADKLIQDSGDYHHIFIEDFIEDHGQIRLVTGS
jgi:hypothetical protein